MLRITDRKCGLMLCDIIPIEASHYEVQLRYEEEARKLGYSELV